MIHISDWPMAFAERHPSLDIDMTGGEPPVVVSVVELVIAG